jgi:hypothetical protein
MHLSTRYAHLFLPGLCVSGRRFPPDLLIACGERRAYDGGMKETIATEAAESAITRQLALVAGALEDCFAKAQAITNDNEYGHKRGAEFHSAVILLKASARLGLALARIKGEFNQNIRVHKGEGEARSVKGGRKGPAELFERRTPEA